VTMSSILAFLLLGHHVPRGVDPRDSLREGFAGPSSVKRCSTSSVVMGWTHHLLLVLLATILILYTGGNTSFNGFPFLANYVANR